MINKLFQRFPAKFCRECGRELVPSIVGAEEYHEAGLFRQYYPYSKYNENTGARQYVRKLACPMYRKGNNHSNFIDSKIL
jgi:hypothetical protein